MGVRSIGGMTAGLLVAVVGMVLVVLLLKRVRGGRRSQGAVERPYAMDPIRR